MKGLFFAAWLSSTALGCSPAEPARTEPGDYPQGAVPLPEHSPGQGAAAAAGAPASQSGDAPEISRSVGAPGGVVVFWPRIVFPRGQQDVPDTETRAMAGKLQARLEELVRGAAPGHAVDLRPEPERVCPRAGCRAATVGVLFTRAGEGCAAVALVSAPGTSPVKLVPWLGSIHVQHDTVAFRGRPEGEVHVTDYVPCSALAGDKSADETVAAAIRAAVK